MYEQAITTTCRSTLKAFGQLSFIKDFYLAGGTALALQIGHRLSTDLDWFSPTNFLSVQDRESLIRHLQHLDPAVRVVSEQDGMLFVCFLDTDVSFIFQQHPLVGDTATFQGVRIASPTDIGLMKLAAINSRGTRRDFVDIYCLRDIAPLAELFALVPQKYANRPDFLSILVRALVYFEDAEQQPMPRMFVNIRWEDVKAYCRDTARDLTRRLSGLDG